MRDMARVFALCMVVTMVLGYTLWMAAKAMEILISSFPPVP